MASKAPAFLDLTLRILFFRGLQRDNIWVKMNENLLSGTLFKRNLQICSEKVGLPSKFKNLCSILIWKRVKYAF